MPKTPELATGQYSSKPVLAQGQSLSSSHAPDYPLLPFPDATYDTVKIMKHKTNDLSSNPDSIY